MTKTITALIWAFLLVISTGCSNEEKEVPKKPSAAASSPVRVSDPPKDLKLATIGGNMCSFPMVPSSRLRALLLSSVSVTLSKRGKRLRRFSVKQKTGSNLARKVR